MSTKWAEVLKQEPGISTRWKSLWPEKVNEKRRKGK